MAIGSASERNGSVYTYDEAGHQIAAFPLYGGNFVGYSMYMVAVEKKWQLLYI